MTNDDNISDMILIKSNPLDGKLHGARGMFSLYFLNLITSSTVMGIQQVLNDRWAIALGKM